MVTSNAFDDQATAVLVPIKDFRQAKNRLSGRLDAPARETLARTMAERVVKAAGNLSVHVVCNDHEVANWAQSVGAEVSFPTTHPQFMGIHSFRTDRDREALQPYPQCFGNACKTHF